jgi:hypothetical protein
MNQVIVFQVDKVNKNAVKVSASQLLSLYNDAPKEEVRKISNIERQM